MPRVTWELPQREKVLCDWICTKQERMGEEKGSGMPPQRSWQMRSVLKTLILVIAIDRAEEIDTTLEKKLDADT